MDFCTHIKLLMNERKIGVNELAELADLSPGHLSRILNGKSPTPKPAYIIKLATALQIDSNQLLMSAGYLDNDSSPKIDMIDFEDFISQNKIVFRGQLLTDKDKTKIITMLDLMFDTE